MAASPNDPRTKRRKAMGDDPNKVQMSVQPLPGSPQGAGNIMNNPKNAQSFNPMPSGLGVDGAPLGNSPYGDNMHAINDGRLGTVDPNMVPPSGQQQGRGYMAPKQNAYYGAFEQPVPNAKQMEMDGPIYNMAQAMGNTEPGGLGLNGEQPSYGIGPMGMMGTPTEQVVNNPISGAFTPQMSEQMPDSIPLTAGVQSATGGMDTKKGKR